MSTSIILVFGVAILVCFTYVATIVLFTIGWFRLRVIELSAFTRTAKVSVIIAARNEEKNIGNCLRAIATQKFLSEFFEIIVVDDHSTDNTVNEINRVIASTQGIQIRLLQLTTSEQGKKTAITRAILAAKNEWIVTTDADCIMARNWLNSLMAHADDSSVHMIMAPVLFKKTKTVFGKLQELEFLSLIVSSAGAVSVGLPIMCNGANLAYRREAFYKTEGFASNKEFVSGDDIFLMMKIRKMYGSRAIRFVKSNEAIVITDAIPAPGKFLNQRLRWVSKSRGYNDPWIIFTSVIIYAQSLLILIAFFIWATGLIGYIFPLMLFTVKLLADLPIMTAICRFAKRSRLMIWFIPLQIFYSLYIVAVGLSGHIFSFNWKGRKLR